MISIYTSAFNAVEGQYGIENALQNFAYLAKEIVVATIPDNKDDTLNSLMQISDFYIKGKIKIVIDENINSKTFAKDGKLKNLALQNCSNDICVQLDLDERIPNPHKWEEFIKTNEQIILDGNAFMIPVIDLYKSKSCYKSIGQKWYIHRREGCHRGVVNFARISDDRFDREKSDGCELIDENGNLIKSISLLHHYAVQKTGLLECMKQDLIPFVAHYGYLDIQRRAKINSAFWKNEWEDYSKTEVLNVKTNENDFNEEFFEHGIRFI